MIMNFRLILEQCPLRDIDFLKAAYQGSRVCFVELGVGLSCTLPQSRALAAHPCSWKCPLTTRTALSASAFPCPDGDARLDLLMKALRGKQPVGEGKRCILLYNFYGVESVHFSKLLIFMS